MHFPTNVGVKNSTDDQHLLFSYISGDQDGSLLLEKTQIVSKEDENHIFEYAQPWLIAVIDDDEPPRDIQVTQVD
jgi:hypothetical protein